VKGDNQVDYGRVVEAMVLLQQAGAGQVGLMTQPSEELRELSVGNPD
jgi:biopolymer transport protein TolR